MTRETIELDLILEALSTAEAAIYPLETIKQDRANPPQCGQQPAFRHGPSWREGLASSDSLAKMEGALT